MCERKPHKNTSSKFGRQCRRHSCLKTAETVQRHNNDPRGFRIGTKSSSSSSGTQF